MKYYLTFFDLVFIKVKYYAALCAYAYASLKINLFQNQCNCWITKSMISSAISHSYLIVDDEGEAATSLGRALRVAGIQAPYSVATNPEKALAAIKERSPSVIIMDLSLNETDGVESGFSLLKELHATLPTVRILVLTGHGSSDHGVRALHLGAASFLEKPASVPHLAALVLDGFKHAELISAYEQLKKDHTESLSETLCARSHVMQAVCRQIEFASRTAQPVLILGETGTGKGVTAKLIHKLSTRANKPFVRYQPNFASSDLTNSDLFGHVKGAFTGALEERSGLVLEASGGSLFLDEIEELPKELQVTLLGVLQEKTFRPVGSQKERVADFRLIAATNGNLQNAIKEGRFRADLFHRIGHFTIELPALRERQEDIPALSEKFLGIIAEKESLLPRCLHETALKQLVSYSWPGNIRQLEAVIEGAALHAHFERSEEIRSEHLRINADNTQSKNSRSFSELVEEYKMKLITEALNANQNNQAKAAELLQLDRSSMRRILARRGM